MHQYYYMLVLNKSLGHNSTGYCTEEMCLSSNLVVTCRNQIIDHIEKQFNVSVSALVNQPTAGTSGTAGAGTSDTEGISATTCSSGASGTSGTATKLNFLPNQELNNKLSVSEKHFNKSFLYYHLSLICSNDVPSSSVPSLRCLHPTGCRTIQSTKQKLDSVI